MVVSDTAIPLGEAAEAANTQLPSYDCGKLQPANDGNTFKKIANKVVGDRSSGGNFLIHSNFI